jgi:hypothetical protein
MKSDRPVGRPRKPEPRTIPVGFKVNEREYSYLQSLSFKHGRSIGEILRFLALAGMPPGGVTSEGGREGVPPPSSLRE